MPRGAAWRPCVFVVLKLLVAASIVTWLFHKVDLARVWSAVLMARPGMVVSGIVLCLGTVVIAGWRWKRLLEIIELRIPLGPLVCIAQIGQFFSMFLPGPLGDDLTRMLYISRLAKGRVGEACTTVVLDRIIGLASVLVLAAACIPWQWKPLTSSLQTYGLAFGIASAGVAVCLGGGVFFLFGAPTSKWVLTPLGWIPSSRLREEARRIWGLVSGSKLRIAQVIGAALVTQVLICGMFALAGRAVGIAQPLPIWLGFVPIVLAANAIPITIAGIGVREYLLVLFLGVLAQVDDELALAASLVTFLMMLSVGLLGGLMYVVYRPTKTADAEPVI